MRTGEVKMRIGKTAISLIDTYFGGTSFNEKFINSTLKIIFKQNLYRLDSILVLFADQNGEINTMELVKEYSNMIDEEGVTFDIKKFVDNDLIKNMIPDKILIIKREDIINMFN